MKHTLTAFLFFLLASHAALGSHLVGGELGLEHQTGATYRLSLTMYYDLANATPGTDEPELTVAIFSKSDNALMQRVTLVKTQNKPITYVNPECASSGLSTNIFVYEKLITLSPDVYNSAAGYYISWERCCRNSIISNIQQPGNTGMVFYLEFPAVRLNNVSLVNSSPVLNAVAGDVLCLNELFTYSFRATDADGDSLVYSLATPLRGHTTSTSPFTQYQTAPYSPVVWNPGNSAANAIPGFPALNIHPQTGFLAVNPSQWGLFVFSVIVTEYRNGIRLGEVRRDFQWKVQDCPQNQPPKVRLQLPGGGNYVQGDTLFIRSAESQCYDFFFKDSINSQLTFQVEPVNFTSPQLSLSPSSGTVTQSNVPVQARLCWPDCSEARPEVYIFDVIVRDRGCPQPKSARIRVKVKVEPDPNDPPLVSTSLGSQVVQYLELGQSVTFDVTGTDPDGDVVTLWAEGQGFSPAALGMQFAGGSGAGTITVPFFWQPDCNAILLNQPLRLVFRAQDNSCFSGNTDTTSVIFYIRDIESLAHDFIPANIFTPNGDGLNDVFTFPGLPLDNCEGKFEKTQVFSRWGKQVFEGTSRTASWDAKGVPDGIYYYLITFSHQVYKGTVTVVR